MDREGCTRNPANKCPALGGALCPRWAIIIKIVNPGLCCWAVLDRSFVWQLSTADHLNGSQELGETLGCASTHHYAYWTRTVND